MLYQLLTGVFPYDVSGSPREIADNILQVDPKPPRLLNRGLDRDVSAIVLKALRKAPDQRYQSAGELGADIERYLNGQPIDAKRDSAAYLLRKYVARHAVWASIAAGYVVLTTIGFFVALGFWLDAVRAHDAEAEQRNLAERARIEAVTNAQRARDNEARAVANADRAHAVTRFLQTMLVAADPTMDQGPRTPIGEVLDFAAKQLDEGEFADAPLAEAGARSALGRTYVRLGLYDAAAKHLDRALQLDLEHRNAGDVVVAEDYNHLGLLAKEQGRFDEAITYYQTALDRLAAGDGDSAALERSVLHNLAVLLRERGSLDEAAGALQRVVELERALQPDDPVRAWTLNTVGLLQRDLGRMEEAEAAFKETLQVLESAYGRDHIYVAAVLDSLGATYALRGGYDAAEPLYLEALAIRQRVLDPNHPHISTSLNNIGFHYFSRERYDDAEPYYLQALAHRRAHLGDQHPSTATSLNNLGLLYARRGAVDEAEPLYREALAIKEATYGVSHRSTLLQMRNLSAVLREREAFAEAEQFSKAALDGYIALFPDGHWRIADQRGEWAACLMGLGRAKEAEQQLLLAHEGLAAELGPDHDRTQDVVQALVRFYQDQRDEAQVVFWQGRLVADPVGRSSTVSD